MPTAEQLARFLTPASRYPVGKSDGEYTEKGADLIHVLWKDEESDEWRLRCKPRKKGLYDFTGVRSVITCNSCKKNLP